MSLPTGWLKQKPTDLDLQRAASGAVIAETPAVSAFLLIAAFSVTGIPRLLQSLQWHAARLAFVFSYAESVSIP